MLFFKNKFIYLFLAALGLHCCAWAFSSCGEWGLLFVAVHGLLIVVASLVVEHGLQAHRLQQLWHAVSVVVAHGLKLLRGMWDLPGPGHEPLSPALAGRILTTAPPGKSQERYFRTEYSVHQGKDLHMSRLESSAVTPRVLFFFNAL